MAISEKFKAWRAVEKALRSGQITKPASCESCGGTALIEGHHEDYSQPLVVQWICRRCHKKAHHSLCPKGHQYDSLNAQGSRVCRECGRQRWHRRQAARFDPSLAQPTPFFAKRKNLR